MDAGVGQHFLHARSSLLATGGRAAADSVLTTVDFGAEQEGEILGRPERDLQRLRQQNVDADGFTGPRQADVRERVGILVDLVVAGAELEEELLAVAHRGEHAGPAVKVLALQRRVEVRPVAGLRLRFQQDVLRDEPTKPNVEAGCRQGLVLEVRHRLRVVDTRVIEGAEREVRIGGNQQAKVEIRAAAQQIEVADFLADLAAEQRTAAEFDLRVHAVALQHEVAVVLLEQGVQRVVGALGLRQIAQGAPAGGIAARAAVSDTGAAAAGERGGEFRLRHLGMSGSLRRESDVEAGREQNAVMGGRHAPCLTG